MENATERVAANGVTATPIVMNGVPGRLAANVRSRPSALHSRTVYDDCGEFREWTDCSEFHAKVTGPGSPLQ
ncbi:MAG UNVERIFIED_CONTAM: hypothetical protein LVR18_12445 [Planctomycetaceae bacterium]